MKNRMGIIEISDTKRSHLEFIHQHHSPNCLKGRMGRTNPNRHVKVQVISKSPSKFHLSHGGVQKSFENLVGGFAPTALSLTVTAIVMYFDRF